MLIWKMQYYVQHAAVRKGHDINIFIGRIDR